MTSIPKGVYSALTHSAAQTQHLGERLSSQLLPGDVLLLEGDMGSGKSELTRGIARGLGVKGHVTSPSFTILQVYDNGRMPLYHFDWYRLGSADELYELSMDEYLYANGVAVIEWPIRAAEAIPQRYLEITLTPKGDDERRIDLQPMGGFHPIDYDKLTEVSL